MSGPMTHDTIQRADDSVLQVVLLAGATGMLGARIGTHLLRQPGVALRLLVRPSALDDPSRRAAVQSLLDAGATTVTGDLTDPSSLASATAGVDVVVSAVQGGQEVVIDGQVALARAAAANGVRRIVPSDFALDVFKAVPGEHATFDLRREADEAIAASGIEHVHVLNGAFLDGLVGFFDHTGRRAAYWGTGDERFEGTTVDDTAAYTARAALDRSVPSGKFAVAGDQVSFTQMIDTFEAVTGHRYTRHVMGTVDDLRAKIDAARAGGASAFDVVMDVYMLYMLTGQTALEDLQNARYPDIHPQDITEVARRALIPAAVAS